MFSYLSLSSVISNIVNYDPSSWVNKQQKYTQISKEKCAEMKYQMCLLQLEHLFMIFILFKFLFSLSS